MVSAPPLVTVLMPTHDRADVIGLAIRTVLDQSLSDFELLVVGDGCTDGTAGIVQGFADPRIRWFDLPKGPGFGYANRNVALRQARGAFVAFAPHDDLMFPDHLELLVAELQRPGCDWAYSRPLWASTDGIIVPFCTNLDLADERDEFLERRNTIPAICVMHRRACLEAVGYWPEDVAEAGDWHLWRRILRAGGGKGGTYVRTPTSIHFSANWKRSRHAGMPEVATLIALAAHSDWWPSVLRAQVPAGTPEQVPVFESLAAGGAAWVTAVRGACRDVIDRIAWDDIRGIRPSMGRLMTEKAGLASDLDTARRRIAKTRASLSWRLTRPLRAAERLARRWRRAASRKRR